MKNILSLILIINLLCMPVLALELDTSLDDEVRKNYNPDKIEQDYKLPALPKVQEEPAIKPVSNIVKIPTTAATTNTTTQQLKPITGSIKKPVVKYSADSCAILKQGTKIKVKSLCRISDRSRRGTKVSFVSEYPVSTTYFTIPMGTTFKGEIVRSHKPQFGANGGLIVIKIDSVVLRGQTQPINAKITKADSKKIFFNNIKGKRKYASSMFKSMRPGLGFFKKMWRTTTYLAGDGASILVSPFSLAIGGLGLGGNIMVSPALAMFHKGGSISIPEGSNFEIKLMQDVFIYN